MESRYLASYGSEYPSQIIAKFFPALLKCWIGFTKCPGWAMMIDFPYSSIVHFLYSIPKTKILYFWLFKKIIQHIFLPFSEHLIFQSQYSFQYSSFLQSYSMLKRVVLFAIFYTTVKCSCLANKSLSDLQSGIVEVEVNERSPSPAIYQKHFQSRFSSTPQMGISVHCFELIDTEINEWKISTLSATAVGVRFFFYHQTGKWKSIKVGYWASTRTDIIIGQGIGNVGSLKGRTGSVVVGFETPIPDHQDCIVRLYLCGVVFNWMSGISIRLYENGLVETALRVNVEAGSTNDVKRVDFSYVIFAPPHAGFSSFGGGLNQQQFGGKKIIDINQVIYHTPYIFYGLVSLTLSPMHQLKFELDIDSSMYLTLSASKQITKTSISYIAIGNPAKNLCSSCINLSFVVDEECMRVCPTNTFRYDYADGGKACRQCPPYLNYQINEERNGCKCREGFNMNDGVCEPVSGRQFYSDFQSFQVEETFSQHQSYAPSLPPAQPQPSYIPQTLAIPQPKTTYFDSNSRREAPIAVATNFIPPSTQSPQMSMKMKPAAQSFTPVSNLPLKQSKQYIEKDCSHLENTYWTGYRCACRVGYVQSQGLCQPANTSLIHHTKPAEFLHRVSKAYTPLQCQQNEQAQGNTCVCVPGCQRGLTGLCQPVHVQCPANANSIDGRCICVEGYRMKKGRCVKVCPPNSSRNNKNECVCNDGYYQHKGTCRKGKPCGANSERDAGSGECVCKKGYVLIGQACTKCPTGQIYIQKQQKCIIPCGINQQLNQYKCQCRTGYGRYKGRCWLCPDGYFLHEGYCVLCPLGSTYHQTHQQCICDKGLKMQDGFCVSQCAHNQLYDSGKGNCVCVGGLGIGENGCEICLLGVDGSTGRCRKGCKVNQILSGKECVCKVGYGWSGDVCTDCGRIGGFLLDGYCASCPTSYIHDGQGCTCPDGSIEVANTCQDQCQEGQLTDPVGRCYWCPLNEVAHHGRCECREGYRRVGRFCQLQCAPNKYVINGRCAICALNTVYDAGVGTCICKEGYYKNMFGYCVEKVVVPINCGRGMYYEEDVGCVHCADGCSTCTAMQCTGCGFDGFQPKGDTCVPKCGDGQVIYGLEDCDDGNLRSGDGCSSQCSVQYGWECEGLPSVCRQKGPICGNAKVEAPQQCDDGNTQSHDGCSSVCVMEEGWKCDGSPSLCSKVTSKPVARGMKLFKDVIINSNNAFILVETDNAYHFNSAVEMKSFLQYKFVLPGTEPTSAYCLQQVGNLRLFQCLLIYASGVPNFPYEVELSYRKNGSDIGFLPLIIDSQAGAFSSRSLV